MDSLQKSHMPRSRRPGQGTWTKQRTRVRLATRAMVNNMSSSAPKPLPGRETGSRVQVCLTQVVEHTLIHIIKLTNYILVMLYIIQRENAECACVFPCRRFVYVLIVTRSEFNCGQPPEIS